jgi:hypothetical protein
MFDASSQVTVERMSAPGRLPCSTRRRSEGKATLSRSAGEARALVGGSDRRQMVVFVLSGFTGRPVIFQFILASKLIFRATVSEMWGERTMCHE